jgi:hypothetical protein
VPVGDGVAVDGGGERVEEASGERRVEEVRLAEDEAAGGSEQVLGVVALVVEGWVERVAGSAAGRVGGDYVGGSVGVGVGGVRPDEE